MQPGEMIWFLVGIGAGLTLAIVGFIVMAVVDGRRLRRLEQAEALEVEETDEAVGPEPRRRVPPVPELAPLPDVPPEPVPVPRRRSAIAELRNAGAQNGEVDEMMSNLAAEIARMQSSESAVVTMELPPSAEPMQGVVEASVQASLPEVPLTPMRAAMAEALAKPAPKPQPVKASPPKAPPVSPKVVVKPTIKAAIKPALPVERASPEAESPQEKHQAAVPEPVTETPAPEKPTVEKPAGEKPAVPPPPRIAPARKFAPALPPRKPN